METEIGMPSSAVRQFSVFLINRAGALFGVVKLLKDSGIEVLGLTVQESVDVSVVRLVVSDPDSAETLFMERGIPFGTCDLLAVELPEGVDDLHKSLHGLLTGETNIDFFIRFSCGRGERRCWPFTSRISTWRERFSRPKASAC